MSELMVNDRVGVKLRTLVEELVIFKNQQSDLNKELKNLKDARVEVEAEIIALLDSEGETIKLPKSVKGILFVGEGNLSGGGFFMPHWEKKTVKLAKDAKAAKKAGLI